MNLEFNPYRSSVDHHNILGDITRGTELRSGSVLQESVRTKAKRAVDKLKNSKLAVSGTTIREFLSPSKMVLGHSPKNKGRTQSQSEDTRGGEDPGNSGLLGNMSERRQERGPGGEPHETQAQEHHAQETQQQEQFTPVLVNIDTEDVEEWEKNAQEVLAKFWAGEMVLDDLLEQVKFGQNAEEGQVSAKASERIFKSQFVKLFRALKDKAQKNQYHEDCLRQERTEKEDLEAKLADAEKTLQEILAKRPTPQIPPFDPTRAPPRPPAQVHFGNNNQVAPALRNGNSNLAAPRNLATPTSVAPTAMTTSTQQRYAVASPATTVSGNTQQNKTNDLINLLSDYVQRAVATDGDDDVIPLPDQTSTSMGQNANQSTLGQNGNNQIGATQAATAMARGDGWLNYWGQVVPRSDHPDFNKPYKPQPPTVKTEIDDSGQRRFTMKVDRKRHGRTPVGPYFEQMAQLNDEPNKQIIELVAPWQNEVSHFSGKSGANEDIECTLGQLEAVGRARQWCSGKLCSSLLAVLRPPAYGKFMDSGWDTITDWDILKENCLKRWSIQRKTIFEATIALNNATYQRGRSVKKFAEYLKDLAGTASPENARAGSRMAAVRLMKQVLPPTFQAIVAMKNGPIEYDDVLNMALQCESLNLLQKRRFPARQNGDYDGGVHITEDDQNSDADPWDVCGDAMDEINALKFPQQQQKAATSPQKAPECPLCTHFNRVKRDHELEACPDIKALIALHKGKSEQRFNDRNRGGGNNFRGNSNQFRGNNRGGQQRYNQGGPPRQNQNFRNQKGFQDRGPKGEFKGNNLVSEEADECYNQIQAGNNDEINADNNYVGGYDGQLNFGLFQQSGYVVDNWEVQCDDEYSIMGDLYANYRLDPSMESMSENGNIYGDNGNVAAQEKKQWANNIDPIASQDEDWQGEKSESGTKAQAREKILGFQGTSATE